MRSVDSTSSEASSCAVSEDEIHRSVLLVHGPAIACTRSTHSASRPTDASGSANFQPSSMPRSSSASSIASSASDASSASRWPRTMHIPSASCWRRSSFSASVRSMPASTNPCSAWLTTSTASTRSDAARRAAAAGLLSSCARPAAIVPSEVRRSRLASRWLMPRITGPITDMTLRWTDRSCSARSMNASRGTIANRHGPSASTVIGTGLSVIAAIAPIQVGPVFAFAGSLRLSTVMYAFVLPVNSSSGPGEEPCSSSTSPSAASRISTTAAQASRRSSESSSKRSMPRSSSWTLIGQRLHTGTPETRGRSPDDRWPGSFREVLVDQGDRHRPLADRAGDALDRACAHVAGDEHAGHGGLEHVRIALEREARGLGVRSREDEAALVAADDALEPVRARRGPDEHEHRVDVLVVLAVVVADPQRAQVVVAFGRDRLRVRAHVDVRDRRDLLDQVVRHRLLQAVAAHEHRDLARVAGEVHGGLPGGVRAADDHHMLVLARARLGERGAVVDALAGEGLKARRG